jgi:Family of unknown function (DUF5677)
MDQLTVFSQRLHDECIRLMTGVPFDGQLHKDGLSVAYYNRLVELTGNYLLLFNRLQGAGASSIFRSFLEAFVEFTNLSLDRNYYKHIFARFHDDRCRILNAAIAGNPYLEASATHPEIKNSLLLHERRLQELRDSGFKPLQAKQRFQKAGMIDEYESIFRFESNGAHSDLASLMQQNLEVVDNEICHVLYREWKPSDFEAHLWSVNSLLLKSTKVLHMRLKSGKLDAIAALEKEWETIKLSALGQST